tara:strand:- start:25 stop:1746 length:1722 start_codon:yes stop_codon:yes gene_type:complete
MKILLKYLSLMNLDMKRKFFMLILLLFFAGLMELFGLAMILPVIKVILEPNELILNIKNYEFLNFLYSFNATQLTALILLLTLIIYVFKNIYLLAVGWYQVTFLKNFTSYITSKVFDNILKKEYLYFTGENSGNFIKILANDSVILRHNLNYCAQIMSEVFTIILISILLFLTHPYAMISTVTLFTFGTLIFLFILKRKTKVWSIERNLFEKKRLIGIKQIINSIRDLKLLNVEKKFTDQFTRDNNIFLNVNRKQELMLSIPKIWIEMLTIVTILFLLFILIFLDDYQILPKSIIPILALYVGASFKLIPSFNRIITGVQSIRFVAPVIEEFKQLSTKDTLKLSKVKFDNEEIFFEKNILIKNINFSYNNKDLVLENLNLDILKGEKIGLLGKSGSGKSTLLDIITGMLDNYNGDVLVDKKNILKGLKSWRNSISYLSQNSVFLDDSIKNNILLGSKIEDDDLLKSSIAKSLLEDLISSLIEKENTKIGENAVKLSGGERQRIGFARIFYLKRDFLILDESTNALDIETESKILDNIWSEFYDKTIIQVSHNPKALIRCDKLFKLSEKKLIQI